MVGSLQQREKEKVTAIFGGKRKEVKDAVPGHYFDGEYSYSRVPDIPQAASAKARQRHRREKGRQAYSDSDSEWSSLERRRSSDSAKGTRKAVPKRMKKKRIPIPVATPKVPQLPAFYSSEGGGGGGGGGGGSFNPRYSDERLLLDPSETKATCESPSASGDSAQSDEDLLLSSRNALCGFRRRTPKEGIPVRPPTVPPLPSSFPSFSPSSGGHHQHLTGSFYPSSHPSSRSVLTSHLSYPSPLQLTSDSDLFSPLCKTEGDCYYRVLPDDESSIEVSSPRDPQSPILTPGQPNMRKELG
ncbi:hypothetical protein Avbf_01284 [Armadillidium vulgare]|nr:hypothetical protein Avbf_01284 [Armadillidium vulgare]